MFFLRMSRVCLPVLCLVFPSVRCALSAHTGSGLAFSPAWPAVPSFTFVNVTYTFIWFQTDVMSGVSKMKVAELREALEARGLDTKGTKPFLVSRLEDAMSRDAAETEGKGRVKETKETIRDFERQ